MKNWAYKYFSEDELKDIQAKLDAVEKNSTGEVILSLREKRTLLERLYSPHELAFRDFDKLGVANTKERTGILIFIIFGEKYYDIIADEGIYAKIPNSAWNMLEVRLKGEFRKGSYFTGLMHLIKSMAKILEKEFPPKTGESDDEISKEIEIS
ncbi:MAG: TPM domain-containing protein [Chlorobi bacterium]|nr:TPM domain-containing protein [Chlorobiota bacterium]MCI0715234.1 TPM domain-containing protein [Chlorobiota bacterium]